MYARHLARVGLLFLVTTLFVGCQWLGLGGGNAKNNPSPEPSAPAAPSTPAITASSVPPANDQHVSDDDRSNDLNGSAEALARKTANHVQTMSPLLTKHTPGTPEPSGVQWADPDDMRLTSAPDTKAAAPETKAAATRPQTSNISHAKPVVEATPATANQVAMVPETKSPPPAAAAPIPAQPPAVQASAVIPPSAPTISSDVLEEKLNQRVKENPRDVAAHLDQQLLSFVRDEPVPQIQSFAPLPTEDRELLSAVLDGLSNFRSSIRADQNMLLAKKIRPLLDMSDRLRTQAELSIPTITLCKRVDGFGVYEPIEPARFPAGKEHPVIVYCEVENFASQLNDKKLWETKLSQEVALYFDTEAGMEVWRDKRKSIVDQSRNRRHDFFVVKMFKLPSNLTIGRYLLKVSIVDEQVRRIAEATLPVLIVAE